MMRSIGLSGILSLSFFVGLSQAPLALELSAAGVRGQAFVEANCAECHAVGEAGDSPIDQAPPLRILGQRYPIDSLAEAFAEGIVTGHPRMPEFELPPEDLEALLVYLSEIQE